MSIVHWDRFVPAWAVLVLGVAVGQQAGAASESARIPETNSPMVIDAVLDEAAWKQAWSLDLEYEVQPGENIPPPVRTTVLVVSGQDAVYFAFRAYDPEPEKIRAHLNDHDEVGADDWVAVILDTFNDERRSFGFLVNPLGVQRDFVETEGGGSDGAWDTIWESAGRITDWGYLVEIRVPFSSLRFQRTSGPQTWGFDAVRSYSRSQRHHIGSFARDRNNSCYLCQARKITGFEGAEPGRNLELVPTLTGQRHDERGELPDGALEAGDEELEAGFTVSWGVTPNLTAAATLNPDFSQVEADARQLEVNERFALFYPEKRPFFMEGADFFFTRMNVLHTRTMLEPEWGLKLVGKEGTHTIGAYVVEDGSTSLLFPGAEGSDGTVLEQKNTSAVLRYKRDVGSWLTLGGMFTSREGKDYSNQVAGVDSRIRFNDTDHLQVEIFASRTEYPDEVVEEYEQPEGRFSDWTADVLFVHDGRRFDLWALYQHVGEDFRTDLGFNPQVGHTAYLAGAEYEWIPDGESWFSHLEVGTEYILMEDADGDLLSRELSFTGIYEGPLQSHSVIQLYDRSEAFNGEVFDKNEIYLHTCMNPTGNSHLYANIRWGDHIDYTHTRLGERLNLSGGFSHKVGRHLLLELSHLYEQMDVTGGELYTANITQGTIAYQFNTRSFIRAIVQYVNDSFNPALYEDEVDERSRELFGQLLFSYKLNPRTVVFLGYTEGRLGTQDYALTTSDRSVFAKLGYSWRL